MTRSINRSILVLMTLSLLGCFNVDGREYYSRRDYDSSYDRDRYDREDRRYDREGRKSIEDLYADTYERIQAESKTCTRLGNCRERIRSILPDERSLRDKVRSLFEEIYFESGDVVRGYFTAQGWQDFLSGKRIEDSYFSDLFDAIANKRVRVEDVKISADDIFNLLLQSIMRRSMTDPLTREGRCSDWDSCDKVDRQKMSWFIENMRKLSSKGVKDAATILKNLEDLSTESIERSQREIVFFVQDLLWNKLPLGYRDQLTPPEEYTSSRESFAAILSKMSKRTYSYNPIAKLKSTKEAGADQALKDAGKEQVGKIMGSIFGALEKAIAGKK